MAIFHLHISIISRKTGRSSVGAAAYRSGQKLVDEKTGEVHDYTRKRGIYSSEILAPDYAPEWVYDREKLWNTVEAVEKRHDAQLARDLDLALPTELSHFQKRSLVHEFFWRECVDRGMVADINLHDFNTKNPHAHVMLSMRHLTEAGFGNKNREWNDREFLQDLRASWSDAVNLALARAGHQERIDHRSLEAQGIERIPQIHLGPNVCEMEKKGIQTERGDRAREIDEANRQIRDLEIQLKATQILIHTEQALEDREREKQAEAKRQTEEAQRQARIEHLNFLINRVVNDLRQQNDKPDSTEKPVELLQPEFLLNPPDYAAEITPVAARLFEFYAAQGKAAALNGQEWTYEVKADDRVYWLSRNDQTGEYNLRGKDRNLNLLLNQGLTEQDRGIWLAWENWLNQQQQPVLVEVMQATPAVSDQKQHERVTAIAEIVKEMWRDSGRPNEMGGQRYLVTVEGCDLAVKRLEDQTVILQIPLDSRKPALGRDLQQADHDYFTQVKQKYQQAIAEHRAQEQKRNRGPSLG